MPFFSIFALLIGVEIYVLVKVWIAYGFINTVFALMAAGVLGAGIARNQGRYILQKLQTSVAQGQMPADQVLHGMLIFIGGLLFIVPGFVSDFIALIFILPGTRHLVVASIKRRFARKVSSGQFRVFTFGNMNMRNGPSGGGASATESGFVRDVSPKVIDVTPISKTPPRTPDDGH